MPQAKKLQIFLSKNKNILNQKKTQQENTNSQVILYSKQQFKMFVLKNSSNLK